MYSPSVTQSKIDAASRKLGFPLERHSVSYVESAVSALNTLVLADGSGLKRPLAPDEAAFIRNERWLSKLDYNYWATRYGYIGHFSENKLIRYSPNIAQRIVNAIRADLEERGLAVMLQQLKARQLGVTTDTELCVSHRVQFYTHVNAAIASSRPDSSEKMSKILERNWEMQPWWLMPRQTAYRAGSLIEFGDLHSSVLIQHGAQLRGISRGDTPQVAHLSELCEFIDPSELVDASLLKAMHEGPFTFLVLESTAMGRQNWWHHTWEYSKENWPRGRSRLCPVFLPWFVGSDIYPTVTWLRAHSVPSDWIPASLTVHHAERAKAYVKTNPLLRKFLGENWEMPKHQMWYWEVEREEYAKKKELNKFYSEMPADDLEAFQSSNVSVFSIETMEQRKADVDPPIAVYGFRGREAEFPLLLQPDEHQIDVNLPRIPVRYSTSSGQHDFRCELVPLRFHGYPTFDPMGKLLVYEMPKPGCEYGQGVDTSEGVGQDRSVIEMCRKITLERNAAFVAEFASPRLNSEDLWPYCLATGQFYSTPYVDEAGGEMLRRPKMVIECRWNGENVQLELLKRGWPHFHQWIRYDRKRLEPAKATKLGWYTVQWSRNLLMDRLIKALRDGYLDTPSPYFVDEMQSLEMDEIAQSLRAEYGGHDDRIMAGGIVFFSLHVLDVHGTMTPVVGQRIERAREQIAAPESDPVYAGPYQGRDRDPNLVGVGNVYTGDAMAGVASVYGREELEEL